MAGSAASAFAELGRPDTVLVGDTIGARLAPEVAASRARSEAGDDDAAGGNCSTSGSEAGFTGNDGTAAGTDAVRMATGVLVLLVGLVVAARFSGGFSGDDRSTSAGAGFAALGKAATMDALTMALVTVGAAPAILVSAAAGTGGATVLTATT
jgi:hypothetical protein